MSAPDLGEPAYFSVLTFAAGMLLLIWWMI